MIRWPLKAEPFAVQAEAYSRSHDRQKYGLWMEQGTGKSAVAYADFLTQLQHERADALCVIAPGYLKTVWEDEAKQWGINMPVAFWPEGQKHKTAEGQRYLTALENAKRPHVFVIPYENLLSSGGAFLENLLTKRRYMLVLDESSAIKNHGGTLTKRVRDFRELCPIRRALSGTPMTQNVMDLWSQLRFLGEINGMNPYQFKNRFAVRGGYKGKEIVGAQNEQELQRILDRCSFRALKKDWWADMPEKLYTTREFEMSGAQMAAYRTMLDEFFALVSGTEVFAEQVIHAMMKLEQITRGFIIDNERVARVLVDSKNNPALVAVRQTIEATRGKVIVFAHHKYSVELLAESLRDFGVAVLRGGMDKDALAAEKARFKDDPNTRLMVAQLSVGSKGHTLLGGPGDDRCATTIYFENTYSLETRSQSEDRNHRHGQDRAVLYIDIVGSAVCKKVIGALQKKQALVTAIVDAVRVTR